jgi:hypothetical protein
MEAQPNLSERPSRQKQCIPLLASYTLAAPRLDPIGIRGRLEHLGSAGLGIAALPFLSSALVLLR